MVRDIAVVFPLKIDFLVNVALDPNERELELMFATGRFDQLSTTPAKGEEDVGPGAFMHVVAYTQRHKAPVHAMFWVAPGAYVQLADYDFPPNRPSSKFVVFSVHTGRYEDAGEPINILGRGKFLIYRESGVSRIDSPRIDVWERRALDSSRPDGELNAHCTIAREVLTSHLQCIPRLHSFPQPLALPRSRSTRSLPPRRPRWNLYLPNARLTGLNRLPRRRK